MPGWWNWHTRGSQKAVTVRSCGFNSRPRHTYARLKTVTLDIIGF